MTKMKLRAPDRSTLLRLARQGPVRPSDLRRSLGAETAARRWLLGAVMPLWLGAGVADWYQHKRARIEETAGPRESLMHSLMLAEAGVPVTLGLLCEVNAGVLATSASALGAHSATAAWDVRYADKRRRIAPVEQHIHSLLEVVPLMATSLLAVLHWDQARALTGRQQRPDFRLRLKSRDPLPPRARAGLLGAFIIFGALPYAEEMYRCWRARPTLKAQPATDNRTPGPLRTGDAEHRHE
ncbi:diguanylate cyclase [Streptomyces sp. G44]|uniref:diguanylate cyclase n=1 Tax=Streptomyces sp. G44 TaxID=2807632 RepID=UPI00195FDC20|nr:diguanylate cyclase [Streptomyces sp. G44]MBM7167113.1 diguanylate cyclase [Streptomyces sp. G44]